MEETNSAQRIVNEALNDDLLDTGVYKIAALKTIKKTASVMETLGKRTQGLEPSDPVNITYDELNDLISLHVANIYLALTSETFRNSRFADEEVHVGKSLLKKELQDVLKEMREQQNRKNNDTDNTDDR